MRREAGSAQNWTEGVARDAALHLYHDIARGSHSASEKRLASCALLIFIMFEQLNCE
jgi:hypothetical protein